MSREPALVTVKVSTGTQLSFGGETYVSGAELLGSQGAGPPARLLACHQGVPAPADSGAVALSGTPAAGR